MFIGSYTYEGGERIALRHRPSEFVSRAKRSVLRENGFEVLENLSRHSVRVSSTPERLVHDIARARRHGLAHVFYTRENGREYIITDRIFVRFRTAKTDRQISRFGCRRSLEVVRRYSERDILYRVASNHVDPVAVVVRLVERDQDVVAAADHDVDQRLTLNDSTAGDPLITKQWHLTATTAQGVDAESSICATDAWELLRERGLPQYGSPEVVIGIIDGGFRMVRPEFSPEKFAGWACVGDRCIISGGPGQLQEATFRMASPGDHGDCCAGLAAAEMNAFCGAGVAPGCRLFPVKCDYDRPTRTIRIDTETYEAIVQEIEPHVDIICHAWDLGGHRQCWPEQTVDRLKKLAREGGRRGKGIVFLWAAGNWNRPISYETRIPVPVEFLPSITSHHRPLQPELQTSFVNDLVDLPGFAHVGAVTSLCRRSHYSNYGPGLSFCAPSNNAHTYGWEPMEDASLLASTGLSFLVDFGGTSAATAIAAGAAALVISANPSLSAADVVSILKSTADKSLDMSAYTRSGVHWDVSPVAPYDRGDFDEIRPDGSWSPWFGHGKLNVRAAVEKALP